MERLKGFALCATSRISEYSGCICKCMELCEHEKPNHILRNPVGVEVASAGGPRACLEGGVYSKRICSEVAVEERSHHWQGSVGDHACSCLVGSRARGVFFASLAPYYSA